MNSADYWARRLKIMEDALKDRSYDRVRELDELFDAAVADIDTQIRAWYQRFAANNGGISYAEAHKLLTAGELKEFKWTVQQYIKAGKEHAVSGAWAKELENASVRVHISRLESLKMQIRQQAEALTQARIKATADAAAMSYTESYCRTAFEVQRGFGAGWSFGMPDTSALQKLLSRPWTADGQTFTARCWTDKSKLVEAVERELTVMLATGESPGKAIDAISKRFGVSKQNAGRVVMTESAYFSSAAQKDCFAALGVKKYRIIGTLDAKTCTVCGSMDGKVFRMSEFKPGTTAPPFHPWCRCCTAPYFDDMEGVGERYARDVLTGERYKLPKDTTYEQWLQLQDEKYGAGTVDKTRRMEYNESADIDQYARYRERLGTDAPKTFEEFRRIKYSDPNAHNELRGLYEYKRNVPEATAADYKAYMAVKSTGIVGSVRVPPKHIDTAGLTFNDAHAARHGCTLEQSIAYVNTAKCSVTRKRWDGYHTGYYSKEGATYVADEIHKIKTAFSREDFDPTTKAVMEVFE